MRRRGADRLLSAIGRACLPSSIGPTGAPGRSGRGLGRHRRRLARADGDVALTHRRRCASGTNPGPTVPLASALRRGRDRSRAPTLSPVEKVDHASHAGAPGGEYILPFIKPLAQIPIVSKFRSTWVISSIRALQTRGLLEQYASRLEPEARDPLLYCLPASWLPTPLVVRHYEACDALQLSTQTLLDIGSDITLRMCTATTLGYTLQWT